MLGPCQADRDFTYTVSEKYVPLIKQRIDMINKWAVWHGDTASKEIITDKNEIEYDTGDAVLFNGLLCSSGTQRACLAVKKSQGDDGRWYRSEFHKNIDTENSFSRDMAKGVILYLITTKDVTAAEKWLNYINKTGRLCNDDTDGRCSMTGTTASLIYYAWKELGLEPPEFTIESAKMDDFNMMFSARYSKVGYNLHLVGVNAYIQIILNRLNRYYDVRAIEIIHERQKNNPFFQYLYEGSTDRVVESTLNWCTGEEPENKDQWSFERDESSDAKMHSMGHDCIFLLQLFLKQ